jgi:hypothetical protein
MAVTLLAAATPPQFRHVAALVDLHLFIRRKEYCR